ncbi:hypothetical protein BDQ17DRAFT_1346909 [Cyathus striatus]|nr:hypothetical protein BDQ17DRAFT_1346909 [Cyathus striatus]
MSTNSQAQLDLPSELCTHIVCFIQDVKDLLRLRSSCKAFFEPATAGAFRSLLINSPCKRHPSLVDCPDITAYVKEIVYWEDRKVAENGLTPGSDSILSNLHFFPGLKALRLYFRKAPSMYEYEYTDSIKPQIAVYQALSLNRTHNISELELSGITAFPTFAFASETFGNFVKDIKTLRIIAITPSSEFSKIKYSKFYTQFWGDPWNRSTRPGEVPGIIAHATHLTSLILISKNAPVHGDLLALHFPRLKRLYLGKFILHSNPEDGVEAFIVRHKSTLNHLTFDRCYIDHSDPSSDQKRLWSEVWVHLGEVMSALEYVFKLQAEKRDWDEFYVLDSIRYVEKKSDYYYNPLIRDPEGHGRDLIEFARLGGLLAERRQRNMD